MERPNPGLNITTPSASAGHLPHSVSSSMAFVLRGLQGADAEDCDQPEAVPLVAAYRPLLVGARVFYPREVRSSVAQTGA